jgi:PAS domain S-box-containing protein
VIVPGLISELDQPYAILDAIPTPVYVWRRSDDGKVRLAIVNGAAALATHGMVHELLDVDAATLYRDEPRIVRALMRTLEDGQPRQYEHEYRMRATGEMRWLRTAYMRSSETDVMVYAEDVTARRLAELALQESEAHFRGVFEQGSTAMSLTRFDGTFIKVNAAFAELLGYTQAELLASTFMAITHPDDLATDVARKDRLTRGVVPGYRIEKRFIHADGHTVWADLSARLIRSPDGAPQHLLSQMKDITTRKLSDAHEAGERDRMAELLARAPAMICTLRGPAHVYEMGNELSRAFLRGRAVIGRPLVEAMPELVEQGFITMLDEVLRTGDPYVGHAVPVTIRGAPGSSPAQYYFNVACQPIAEPDGTRSGIFVHAVDVTELADAARRHERLLAELHQERARLAASQERHELVLKATRDVIYDWDVVSNVVQFSIALDDVYGHTRQAPTSVITWWAAQIHRDDRERITSSLEAALRSDAEFWAEEYRFRRGDGSFATVFDRGHIIRDASGAPVRMIGSLADLTEQRRLEAQLRESQKMEAVGRLAGGVAHDFNNLLCAILGYTDLALMDAHESNTVRDELEEIRKAAQRAAQLTKQLLAFGRRQIRRPANVDVNAVVRDTSRLLTQLLGEHVHLITQPTTARAVVHMDPGELDQILVNLVVNARDAMPNGGTVSIETAHLSASEANVAGGDVVVLTVGDSGSGIEPEALPHIFEPFFTTKGEAGTGLGLATVYGIVEQNGGRIDVESVVGEGTRFRVQLPASNGAAEQAVPPVSDAQQPSGSATVLLAEDETGVRTLARRILERAGFRVLEARHGADALMLWRTHADSIDVAVTDLVMPEMDGRTLADALRESRPTLPVLFMSGYSDDEVTRRGFVDARIAYLAKPFTAEGLLGAVRQAMAGVAG